MSKVESRKSKAPGKKPRQRKSRIYNHFRLSKPIKSVKTLPKGRTLLKQALQIILSRPKTFLTFTLIYGLLTIFLVKGFGNSINVSDIKSVVDQVFAGQISRIGTALALLGYISTTAGAAPTEAASVYQGLLVLVVSLALIWLLRQLHAGKKASVKEAFYKGMYPLVPVILIMLIIGLQLLPAMVGFVAYDIVAKGALATGLDKYIFGTGFFLLSLLSVYMVSSSIFALYIVTLPEMTPLAALRSARQLVMHRRLAVIWRIVLLLLVLMIFTTLIMLPVVLWLPIVAEWAFFALSMAALVFIHSYIYNLYRNLL